MTSRTQLTLGFIAGDVNLVANQMRVSSQMVATHAATMNTAQATAPFVVSAATVKNQPETKVGASNVQRATQARREDVQCALLAQLQTCFRLNVLSVLPLQLASTARIPCAPMARNLISRGQVARHVSTGMLVWLANASIARLELNRVMTELRVRNANPIR